MKKSKKLKRVKPLKIIKRIIDEARVGGFNIYSHFNLDDDVIPENDKLDFVYNNFEAIEFRHDLMKALFPDYSKGTLFEWKHCPKCNRTIAIKNGEDERDAKINIDEFKFCPYCGGEIEYKAQKNMYLDVYIYRLRDTVAMENKDDRLQYFWQVLEEKEKSKLVDAKLDKQIIENVNKYNK